MSSDIHENLKTLAIAASDAATMLEALEKHYKDGNAWNAVDALVIAKRVRAALSAVQTSTSGAHEACKVALRAFQDNLGWKGKRAQAPWLDAWKAVHNAVGRE